MSIPARPRFLDLAATVIRAAAQDVGLFDERSEDVFVAFHELAFSAVLAAAAGSHLRVEIESPVVGVFRLTGRSKGRRRMWSPSAPVSTFSGDATGSNLAPQMDARGSASFAPPDDRTDAKATGRTAAAGVRLGAAPSSRI
jgi:hypothetical protein